MTELKKDAIRVFEGLLERDVDADPNKPVSIIYISPLIIDEALKALKAEPCEDAISRKAVLNTLENMDKALDENRTVEAYKELLKECYKELPSVKPKAKWIPITERLPKSNGVYIVSRWFNDGFEERILTDACYFDGVNTWHNDKQINHGREYATDKIVAWMPLPKQYEGEVEE